MKKIVLFVMTLMMAGSLFAKPVDFESGDYYIITDDENEQTDFSGMSDLEIVTTVLSSMPKKTGEYENRFVYLSVDRVDEMSRKYFNYMMFSKDGTHFILVQNLGDGRQLTICYRLKK